jgi:drug/metabolite transporter (DMT)-like permease
VLELRRSNARMTAPITLRLALLMTVPPLLWAGNAVMGRLAVGHVPPLTLNALRWALALVILLPWAWPAVATPEARAALRLRWKPLALLGLLGVGAYNALQYMALTTSSPLNVTLIAASMPVGMLAIGAAFYRTRPTARELLGAALSLAGVAVVLARGEWSQLAAVRFVPGDVLMIGAVAAWAFYSWQLARPHPLLAGGARPPWDWAGFLFAQMLFGAAFAGAAALGEAVVTAPAYTIRWSPWVIALLAYVAVGPALIAYRCWGLGVAQAGPALAALFSNLTPLFAAALSAALLGEAPQGYHMVAFGLIVAGIVASVRR